MMFASDDRAAPLSAALLHPLWLGALGLLVLNDHVLKGSGLLPGIVTGKLSDVAGLIVAPVLFALVLRAVLRAGGRLGWLAAHACVGLVFAAIQVWAPAADGWSALMGAFGFPWAITMDPTDLLALPALAVSHRWLRPDAARAAAVAPRTVLEVGAAATGLLACVATSPGPGEPFRPSISADVYVHNSGDADLVIRIRRLSPSVDIDCGQIAADPGRLLPEALFGPATSWTLAPGVNQGLWTDEGAEGDGDGSCRVVLFDADSLPPAIVFWMVGDPAVHVVEGEAFDPEDRGGIELAFDEEGGGHYVGGDDFVFAPVAEPPQDGVCSPQSDGDRLDWSEPVPAGQWEISGLERGFDGCWAFDLASLGALNQTTNRWYMCAPVDELPFAIGDAVKISPRFDGSSTENSDFSGVVIERFTPADLEEEVVGTQLQATRGAIVPQIQGMLFAQVPDFECGFSAEPVCGTAARSASLTVGSGGWDAATLRPGDPGAHLRHEDGSTADVWLTHAQDRIALDPECAAGPDTLGVDLEVVVIYTPAP